MVTFPTWAAFTSRRCYDQRSVFGGPRRAPRARRPQATPRRRSRPLQQAKLASNSERGCVSSAPRHAIGALAFAAPCPPDLCRLLAEGREQGFLAGSLIAAALQDSELAVEQVEELLAACSECGIEVLEEEAPAPALPGAPLRGPAR